MRLFTLKEDHMLQIELTHVAAGLMFFLGTFLMVGSYEAYPSKKSSIFFWASTGVFTIASFLLGVHSA